MIFEDPIVGVSRTAIYKIINQLFPNASNAFRANLNNDIFVVLDVICKFYYGISFAVRQLPLEDKDDIISELRARNIYVHSDDFVSLRSLIRKILDLRYRTRRNAFDRERLFPKEISAISILGQYSFDDFICLNNNDYECLKKEYEAFEINKNFSQVLSEIISDNGGDIYASVKNSYRNLPVTKNLRPYQRLRLLDEIFVENCGIPMSIWEIDKKMHFKANLIGIKYESLWNLPTAERVRKIKITKELLFDGPDYAYQEIVVNLSNRYAGDFLALEELIIPDYGCKKKTKASEVFDLSIKGKRCYKSPELCAFKVVIPSSKAEDLFRELMSLKGEKYNYMKIYPLIYKIGEYGRLHLEGQTLENTQNMKYFKTGKIIDNTDYIFDKRKDFYE